MMFSLSLSIQSKLHRIDDGIDLIESKAIPPMRYEKKNMGKLLPSIDKHPENIKIKITK